MKFKTSSQASSELIPTNEDDLNFSFVDVQKLAFKKISEVSLKASEFDNINHQEAAQIIKRLIDILKITLNVDRPDLFVDGRDDPYDLPF